MRIVQFNIWQGRLLQQIIRFLKEEADADVICLQEVYSSAYESDLFPYFSSLERIQATLPAYQVFFSPMLEMQILDKQVKYGTAILSRLPMDELDNFEIYGTHTEAHTDAEANPGLRSLQRVRITTPDGNTLYILNHHGYWEPNPMGSNITVQAMQKVADIVVKTPQPRVLCGDLNIIAESPAMEPLRRSGLTSLTETHCLPTTLSPLGKVANVPCDHICISAGITPHNYRTVGVIASDHLPVMCDFDLEQATSALTSSQTA